MDVQKTRRGPYASTGSIKKVIEKHRQIRLPTVDLMRLQNIGITEALAPRTLHALVFLGFYDEDGKVTPEFDALCGVPEEDFKPRLAALLRKAYAPILEVLDPATAMPADVENAFRGFQPVGQLPRMVQLFIGLMTYVGIMPEVKRHVVSVRSDPPRAEVRRLRARVPSVEVVQTKPPVEREVPRMVESAELAPSKDADDRAERREVMLGDAGKVTIIVEVNWLDLSDDQFTELRGLIKRIESLGGSGPDHRAQPEVTQ